MRLKSVYLFLGFSLRLCPWLLVFLLLFLLSSSVWLHCGWSVPGSSRYNTNCGVSWRLEEVGIYCFSRGKKRWFTSRFWHLSWLVSQPYFSVTTHIGVCWSYASVTPFPVSKGQDSFALVAVVKVCQTAAAGMTTRRGEQVEGDHPAYFGVLLTSVILDIFFPSSCYRLFNFIIVWISSNADN